MVLNKLLDKGDPDYDNGQEWSVGDWGYEYKERGPLPQNNDFVWLSTMTESILNRRPLLSKEGIPQEKTISREHLKVSLKLDESLLIASGITVVPAHEEDLDVPFLFREIYFKGELAKRGAYRHSFDDNTFRLRLKSIISGKSPGIVVIAWVNSYIVGYAISQETAAAVGEITEIAVHKGYRNNEFRSVHLAKFLFAKALEGIIRSPSIKTVFVEDYSPGRTITRLAQNHFGFHETEADRISELELRDTDSLNSDVTPHTSSSPTIAQSLASGSLAQSVSKKIGGLISVFYQ